MKCNVCPRNCNIDREKMLGFCNEGNKIRIAKIIENFMWEEPPLVGEKGTYAIFFSGCNLKCSYCQNYKISRGGVGDEYSITEFINLLKKADNSSSETIDLITPTHFTNQILEAFKIYRPQKPVIWNSSAYEKEESILKISKYITYFLPDLKYYDRELSLKFSNAKDYFEVAIKAIKIMQEKKPNKYKNGKLISGTIIRHLILPDQVKDSKLIIDKLKEVIPNPIFSIMSQFTPSGEKKEGRKIKEIERKIVLSYALKRGIKSGFIQDKSSADEIYIPKF